MQIAFEDCLRFKRFYHELENRDNIFFMFFTSNLLYYAMESISLVPAEVNLVIVTAGLTEEEIDCIHVFFLRPHFNFEIKYHDTCIWDMLHKITDRNFGWLDVDCFVFNSNLFAELTDISTNCAINTVWARPYDYYGVDGLFANTYFQYLNTDILKHMSEQYKDLSLVPRVFSDIEGEPIYGNYKYLSEEEAAVLKANYPDAVNNKKGYDTTHHYQILLRIEGYNIKRVRQLNQLGVYYSDELLHLGGCYRMHEAFLDKGLRKMYFRFNMRYSFYLLNKYIALLPKRYLDFQKAFAQNMEKNKLSTDIDEVLDSVQKYAERNGINVSHIGVNEYDGL